MVDTFSHYSSFFTALLWPIQVTPKTKGDDIQGNQVTQRATQLDLIVEKLPTANRRFSNIKFVS